MSQNYTAQDHVITVRIDKQLPLEFVQGQVFDEDNHQVCITLKTGKTERHYVEPPHLPGYQLLGAVKEDNGYWYWLFKEHIFEDEVEWVNYLHDDSEEMYDEGRKLGLTDEAIQVFKNISYEHKMTYMVNVKTGEGRLIKVDDRLLAPEEADDKHD